MHNHTSGTTDLSYGVNNIEIYNQGHVDDVIGYAKMLGYPDEDAWGLGITLNNFAIYGERDVNMPVPFPGFPTPIPLRSALYYATLIFSGVGQWLGAPEAPLNSWDDLLMDYVDGAVDTPTFGVANSDAHNTGDPDSYVGVAKNGAYLKKGLSAREFYKAIKAGRTFATTGPSLAFDVDGELMGDTAYVFDGAADVNLSVSSESPTAILVKIDVIKNGAVWQTLGPMAAELRGHPGGRRRGRGWLLPRRGHIPRRAEWRLLLRLVEPRVRSRPLGAKGWDDRRATAACCGPSFARPRSANHARARLVERARSIE